MTGFVEKLVSILGMQPVNTVWATYKGAGHDPLQAGQWFDTFGIVTRCRRQEEGMPTGTGTLLHDLGYINCTTMAHTFERDVKVEAGSYILEDVPERDSTHFTVEVRPQSLTNEYAIWDPGGPYGRVTPAPLPFGISRVLA